MSVTVFPVLVSTRGPVPSSPATGIRGTDTQQSNYANGRVSRTRRWHLRQRDRRKDRRKGERGGRASHISNRARHPASQQRRIEATGRRTGTEREERYENGGQPVKSGGRRLGGCATVSSVSESDFAMEVHQDAQVLYSDQ